MSPEASLPVEAFALGSGFHQAVLQRFAGSGAERYGVSRESFLQHVAAVLVRYGGDLSEAEKLKLLEALHLEDLVLARACSAGNDLAWSDFVARFRPDMVAMARQITRDDAAGHELADGLYADLYGMRNREGKRVSKLDYYMGRGSLKGWLRTVLAQQYVNRCRSHAKDVSLDEQVEAGIMFAAKPEAAAAESDARVSQCVAQSLAELDSEERFVLASYYLDQRTLADIGRQLRVHESTISRRLEKITGALRKRIRRRLQDAGLDPRRCDEIMQELDVRDLNLDVAANLRQERPAESFQGIDGN
jgi:RNA polymerase sigma-70 factor, ECF subfamily